MSISTHIIIPYIILCDVIIHYIIIYRAMQKMNIVKFIVFCNIIQNCKLSFILYIANALNYPKPFSFEFWIFMVSSSWISSPCFQNITVNHLKKYLYVNLFICIYMIFHFQKNFCHFIIILAFVNTPNSFEFAWFNISIFDVNISRPWRPKSLSPHAPIVIVQQITVRYSKQGRNFREAMKAMAAVAPQFGLVPLKQMPCTKATVALMPQLTVHSTSFTSVSFLSICRQQYLFLVM